MGRLGELAEPQPGRWVLVGLWCWVDACPPKGASPASHPRLPPNCTSFSRAGRGDRLDRNSRVRVSLCCWGRQQAFQRK